MQHLTVRMAWHTITTGTKLGITAFAGRFPGNSTAARRTGRCTAYQRVGRPLSRSRFGPGQRRVKVAAGAERADQAAFDLAVPKRICASRLNYGVGGPSSFRRLP